MFFIYDEDCQHCIEMKDTVLLAIDKSNIPCNFKEFLYTNKVAINIAINNDIDDLPGLVVESSGGVFCGEDYTEERIIEAIKKVALTWE